MLIILVGGDEVSLEEYADEFSELDNFDRYVLSDFDPERLLNEEIGSYRPGTRNLLLTHWHWHDQIARDTPVLSDDFKLMEYWLASRGGITVVMDSMNPIIDMIHRQTLTSHTEGQATGILALAKSYEVEAEPLQRWRFYTGPIKPLTLVIAPPDREIRKSIIHGLTDEDEWTTYGFATSGAPPDELEHLWLTLDTPELIGVDKLPQSVENWVASRSGNFQLT